MNGLSSHYFIRKTEVVEMKTGKLGRRKIAWHEELVTVFKFIIKLFDFYLLAKKYLLHIINLFNKKNHY